MQPFDEQTHVATGQRRARIMAIVLGVLALSVGIFGNIYKSQQQAPDLSTHSSRIEYHVTGSSTAVEIQYLNDLAYRDTRSGTPPWRFSFRAVYGRDLYVHVINRGSGTIGCEISTNGQTISKQIESETDSIECMGVVPEPQKD